MCNLKLRRRDDMEYGSIERELHIDASPEVVFEVLTSPDYIRDWWSAETDFEPVAGATSQFTWTNEESGSKQSAPFTVFEVDPPRRFSFRWTYDEDEVAGPDNSLLVTFELIPAGEGTAVRFRESGFRERGWEAAVLEAHYNDHRQGWDFYLPRLVEAASLLTASRRLAPR
jgi:uncharacterized protein YndB with AHSA1/START domain